MWPFSESKYAFAHQTAFAADMPIQPFSRWRPSAIFNFRNLLLWSCGLCLSVILLLYTKFRVNRTINCWDIAKRRFSTWRPSATWIFKNLLFCSHDLCMSVMLLLPTKFHVNRIMIHFHVWILGQHTAVKQSQFQVQTNVLPTENRLAESVPYR